MMFALIVTKEVDVADISCLRLRSGVHECVNLRDAAHSVH